MKKKMIIKIGTELDFIPRNSRPGYKVFPGVVEKIQGCFVEVETWNPYLGKNSPHFHEVIPISVCYPKNTVM